MKLLDIGTGIVKDEESIVIFQNAGVILQFMARRVNNPASRLGLC